MVKILPEVLEKLRCNNCKEYLSCTPVFVNKNGENICGRCPILNTSEFFPNTAYEYVASMLKFPCRFKKDGCQKTLTITEVKEHEKNCEYQKISCFSLPSGNCNWKGVSSNLLQHFREKHIDLVVDHPYRFKHDITRNNEKNLLASTFGFIFLIQIKSNLTANISHSVCLIGPHNIASQFKYYLNLKKEEMSFDNNKPVDQMSKIICSTKNCMDFDLKAIDTIFGGFQDLQFTLSIIRHKIKCISCSENITETKTNVTVECATFCDTCNSGIPVTEKGMKPCNSHIDGCSYNGNAKNMPKHSQWYCKFGVNKCQFCNNIFKTNTRIYHLMNKCNQVLVLYSSVPTNERNINEQPVIFKVDVFGKEFFCICSNKKKNLAINIVTEYPKEEMESFSVEVTVESDKLHVKNQRLLMSDEANCDWKGVFNVTNAADVKFVIKKCK